MIGKQAYIARTDLQPTYRGSQQGIIVEVGDEEKFLNSERIPKGSTLIGAWCEVGRSDRDFKIRVEVGLKEWQKLRRLMTHSLEIMY